MKEYYQDHRRYFSRSLTTDSMALVPPFIGNDYYCDSGVDSNPQRGVFYTTPLWTGKGCTPPNFCCPHSGIPWFCKTLPVPTTDYIEVQYVTVIIIIMELSRRTLQWS